MDLWKTISEEEIIWNSETEFLYLKDYENKRFWNITFEEKEFNVSKRIRITLVISSSWEIKTFKLKKIKLNKWNWEEENSMSFSSFSIEKIISFLSFLNENITKLKEWKIELSEVSTTETVTKKQIRDFLSTKNWEDIIESFLESSITQKDIINIWYRKQQLKIFEDLLNWTITLKNYRDNEYKNNFELCKKYWLTDKSIWEKVWQYFFQKNTWIFWYWLDYRFMWIIQREADLSTKTVWWKESVNWDFLVWDNNYVHFVELKLPNTPLFLKYKGRSNTWKLSDELFNAKSQILEQKASWLVKLHQKHSEEDLNYKKINWKSYDSKVMLIIWDIDEELKKSWDEEWIKEIKRKTFELFRRDSRNIEIITYKELYDRAKFIIENTNFKIN